MHAADTIAALATPFGAGAVALVRMSGPRAVELARKFDVPVRVLHSQRAGDGQRGLSHQRVLERKNEQTNR
jgi:tRNA U34 5-carboxymethylaminomethyl modifying GTPase MnmE/TrmE